MSPKQDSSPESGGLSTFAQYRVLTAARAASDFTKPELVERTGLSKNTVDSICRRHGARMFERTGTVRALVLPNDKRLSRSAPVWRMRPAMREEMERLLEGLRGSAPTPGVELARIALADDHARWRAHMALRRATGLREKDERARALSDAQNWLRRERDRQRRWGSVVEVPADVRKQTEELSDKIEAVLMGVDLLTDHPAFASLEATRAWILAALTRAANGLAQPFLPLDPPAEPPGATILRLLRWSEHSAALRNQVILAAFVALSDAKDAIRVTLCDICDAVGDDDLSVALTAELDAPDWRHRQDASLEAMALRAQLALNSYPALLDPVCFPKVRSWFDRSYEQWHWRDEFAPLRVVCAPIASRADVKVVVERMRPSAELVKHAAESGGLFEQLLGRDSVAARTMMRLVSEFDRLLNLGEQRVIVWTHPSYEGAQL